ncbi:MAG: SDR family NAD(P)-dependent oxidoreductase [Dehalococcoidia bacterium]|jgi:short-subunit dehydrogenase
MANVLITGCKGGIGLDAAQRLAARGHSVYATVHSEKSIEAVKASFGPGASNVNVEKVDITDPADREKASRWDIDVLINNAAIGDSGPLAEIDLERVKRVLDVNIFASLDLTRKFIPKMAEKKHGRIIFIGSMAGLMPTPFLAPYGISKFALENVAFSLRTELKPFGIEVVMVNPGGYNTDFNRKNIDRKYEWLQSSVLYKDHMDVIKKEEAMIIRSELQSTSSIAMQIVKAVEALKPKRRYVAPMWQWWMIPLLREFR